MVSTSAFGEGVDIPDIGAVIIYDLPASKVELLQFAGRAGRDGRIAPVWLLGDPQGRGMRQGMIKSNWGDAQRIYAQAFQRLDAQLQRKSELTFDGLSKNIGPPMIKLTSLPKRLQRIGANK